MRPLYESQGDRDNEAKVQKVLESKWKVELHKLPISYKVDYLATDYEGLAKAWIEVKKRKITIKTFPDIMVSAHKIRTALSLSKATCTPFIFVADLIDGIFYYKWKEEDAIPCKWGGRTVATRDSADVWRIANDGTKH